MPLDLKAIKKSISQEKSVQEKGKDIFHFFVCCVIFVTGLVLLFCFVLGVVRISGSSMYPEVKGGDIVIYNRLNQRCDNGDIVIIRDEVTQTLYIKRVIAGAGAVVNLTLYGSVTVNGVLMDEAYVGQLKTTAQDLAFPQTVPPGCVFVLGDNRPVSKDSRNSAIGMIPTDEIRGTLLLSMRVFP